MDLMLIAYKVWYAIKSDQSELVQAYNLHLG